MKPAPDTLIVGLGSSHGDDQLGWRVADELRRLAADLDVIVRQGLVPLDLLDWLTGIRRLYLCDAGQGDGQPGSVQKLVLRGRDSVAAVEPLKLVSPRSRGSHDFGVSAVLELASRLGRLPGEIVIYAVLGSRFGPGESMTPEVERAVPGVARTIWEEVLDARNVADAVPASSSGGHSSGPPGVDRDRDRN